MRGLLDDDYLQGVHQARIAFRPAREALPVASADEFVDRIMMLCQRWSGANASIIPVAEDGSIDLHYRRILAGSHIDRVVGLDHRADLAMIAHLEVEARVARGRRPEHHGKQFAPALLDYREQDNYRPLQIIELDPTDRWRGIYAACLGLLPHRPETDLLTEGDLIADLTFEDFVRVERLTVTGSFEDLLTRVDNIDVITPRRLSMVHLAYGTTGSTSLRSRTNVIPEPDYARFDAGPNIIVACTPGDVGDLALLWNLRAAHGDSLVMPIGIPVDELTQERLHLLVGHDNIARNGATRYKAYVTSASVSTQRLRELIQAEEGRNLAVAALPEILHLGRAAGLSRNELLAWENGRARFLAMPTDSNTELFDRRAMSSKLRMYYDLEVPGEPFPPAPDVRVEGETMNQFYAGCLSGWTSPQHRAEVREERWPHRLLIAQSLAAVRCLQLRESEPGRSARVALSGLQGLYDLTWLAHEPLLRLLEEMAARQGFNFFKDRLRERGQAVDPLEAVAPTSEDLPERAASQFKKAFNNNEKATRYWLLWAENAGLIVKGFQLDCDYCRARQWIPVAGFAPPIVCRGCARTMTTPFGAHPTVTFKYRLSERLRRVYAQDAIGHLLAIRYFDLILQCGSRGRMIGQHPGMEVLMADRNRVIGEADVLILTRAGEFVPVEVKRSASGFTDQQVHNLDTLSDTLSAPWSAAVVCQYGARLGGELTGLESRDPGASRFRVALGWDRLLDLHPIWSMGMDPFDSTALTEEQITEREKEFVAWLSGLADTDSFDWLQEGMLRKRETPTDNK